MKDFKKPVTRIEELEVQEISIVDKAANKRRFLAVKSEVGMDEKGEEIVKDSDGNLVTNSKETIESEEVESKEVIVEEVVEKAGAKMSKERLNQFKNAMDMLYKILGQLSGSMEMQKSESQNVEKLNNIEAMFESLLDINLKLVEKLAKSEARIKKMEKTPVVSNVIPIESKIEKRFDSSDVAWPMDLNDEK